MVKGVYVLVISVARDVRVNVGALGSVNFEKGLYTYVGSAQINLEKRLERHLKKAKQKFWHIDYLLGNEHAKIVEVFYKETEKSEECKIAREISKMGFPMKGLGSSDCKCKSHLIKVLIRDVKNMVQFFQRKFKMKTNLKDALTYVKD